MKPILGFLVLPALLAAQGTATPPAGPVSAPQRGATPAPAPALPGPPIRKIESATHVSTELLGAISGVRQLSDGRVLVNDGTRRRLLMMDSTLKAVKVVLDSSADTENAYGTALGGLITYRGDTSLFIDRASYSMLVLDGEGRIVRVRAVPTTSYLTNLTSGVTSPAPGVDPSGRLVFRIAAKPAPPPPNLPANVFYEPPPPDSAFVVRLDLNTRKYDTAGVIRIPKANYVYTQTPEGGMSVRSMVNPFPTTDDWGVLSDGTIAFIRGIDYRVEWVDDRNGKSSSAKLPFDWVRLADDDKLRISDSLKKQQAELMANRYYFEMVSWVNMFGQPYPKDFTFPSNVAIPPGLPANWVLPPGLTLPPGYERGAAMTMPGMPAGPVGGTSTTVVQGAAGRGAPPPDGGRGAGPPASATAQAATAGGAAGGARVVAGGAGGAGGPAPTPAPAPPPMSMAAAMGMTTIPPMPTQTTTSAIAMATVMPIEDWPGYKPPFAVNAARADRDGNLWVRINLMRPIPGGIIYDVINRQGELFDRIQLPPGHTLVGFGPGRVVYLSVRDATGLHLARVKLK